jgi:hypothetical protein
MRDIRLGLLWSGCFGDGVENKLTLDKIQRARQAIIDNALAGQPLWFQHLWKLGWIKGSRETNDS